MRAWYRVRQFGQALLALFAPADLTTQAAIRSHLPGDAWSLFSAMAAGDQRHGWLVLRSLQARGFQDPPLMQAALLHDCAKHAGRVRLWHRVAVVLLRAFWPAWLERWGQGPPPPRRDWRYPFWAHYNHPRLGAEMAAAMGCDPRAALLIARHQDHQVPAQTDDPDFNRWLAALRRADDDS